MFFCRFYSRILWVMDMGEWLNRKTVRLQGYDYNTPGAYFLTVCKENRKCLLSRIVGTGTILTSI